MSRLLGILAAFVAASLFNLGLAVQALDAREVPAASGLRLSLLTRLLRRTRWLAGTALTVAGWPFQVLAFALTPVVIVQPALALGLVVLLVAGVRLLDEPVGRREALAVLAILAGVGALGALAPGASDAAPYGGTLAIVLGALALASLAPYAASLGGRASPVAMMLGAGVGYATSAMTTVLVERALAHGALAVALGWALATAAFDAAALTSEMSALGRRPAVQVAPVIFVVSTLVPIGLAPVVFHERFGGPARASGVLVALAAIVLAAIALVRSPALLAVVGEAGAEAQEPRRAEARV